MIVTNAEIKLVKSLKDKKFRDELGLFVVEGEKMVAEVLKSDFRVEKVFRKEEVGAAVMERLSALSSPSPCLALVHRKPALSPSVREGLCLALDSVRDPGNVGTIIRVADWFGIDTLYLSADCADIYNPKVIQSSMGSIFRVRTASCDIPLICSEFRKAGMEVYGTLLDGENIYRSTLASKGLIVMGNEGAGISAPVRALVSSKLLIPSFEGSGAESLNVAAATAITLSEFRRR